ncbi:ABC transporter substrate-binding protein [Leeia aquatica]|uniref:ABC transporter substrate-binding protein n=1 Tax=Leeia aquatica TaxID=2725557 RepID=A0A847S1X0_9NEIS|nr:ABC transporter substrate-binding protein [Leeia aquatica]NLR73743.1 ABC transporter substrate-binding protein [Leeia aquatica]
MLLQRYALLVLTLALGLAATVRAEPGVEPARVLFGQSAGVTGPYARVVEEYNQGLQAAFQMINDQGGVNGRRLELKTLDDASLPDKTLGNVTTLIQKEQVFGLAGVFGTANNQQIADLIFKEKVPSIAPYTGSDVTRIYHNPMQFNIRASYRDESERIVRQLVSLGIKRIGVLYQDDSYGEAGLEGIERAMRKNNLDVAASAKYDRTKLDVTAAVKQLADAKVGAVILVAVSKPAADFIHGMKQRGINIQYFALSPVDASELYALLKEEAVGVAISQVMPNPITGTEQVVGDFQRAMRKYAAGKPLTYPGIEGFMTGWVIIEGLKKAGSNVTRKTFVEALESMDDKYFGGFPLRYLPSNHRGSTFVDFVVISKGGRLGR